MGGSPGLGWAGEVEEREEVEDDSMVEEWGVKEDRIDVPNIGHYRQL